MKCPRCNGKVEVVVLEESTEVIIGTQIEGEIEDVFTSNPIEYVCTDCHSHFWVESD